MFDSIMQQLRSALDYSSSWGQLIVMLWIALALIATVVLMGNAARRESPGSPAGPEESAGD